MLAWRHGGMETRAGTRWALPRTPKSGSLPDPAVHGRLTGRPGTPILIHEHDADCREPASWSPVCDAGRPRTASGRTSVASPAATPHANPEGGGSILRPPQKRSPRTPKSESFPNMQTHGKFPGNGFRPPWIRGIGGWNPGGKDTFIADSEPRGGGAGPEPGARTPN